MVYLISLLMFFAFFTCVAGAALLLVSIPRLVLGDDDELYVYLAGLFWGVVVSVVGVCMAVTAYILIT